MKRDTLVTQSMRIAESTNRTGGVVVFPYILDSGGKVAIVTLAGTVRGADITDTMEIMYRDPAWQYGFDTLWDGTTITELLCEKEDTPGFVALQQRYAAVAGPGREVIVATRPFDQIMARIYGVMSGQSIRQGHICRSESEAWKILRRARDQSFYRGADLSTARSKSRPDD